MKSEERGPTLVALLVLLGDKPWNRNKDAGGSIPQLRTVMEVVKEICRAKRCPAAVPRVSHPLPGIRRSIRSSSNSRACDVLSSIQHAMPSEETKVRSAFYICPVALTHISTTGTNHPRRRARPRESSLHISSPLNAYSLKGHRPCCTTAGYHSSSMSGTRGATRSPRSSSALPLPSASLSTR